MKTSTSLRALLVLSLALPLGGLVHSAAAADDSSQPSAKPRSGGWVPQPKMIPYGYGYGMLGGPMMSGPIMGGLGMGPLLAVDLTAEQQAKITGIQDETRKKQWEIMGKMMDEMIKLRGLYAAPRSDNQAIDSTYKRMSELRQQAFEAAIEAHKRMEAVLTEKQKEKLKSLWRQGWTPDF